MADTIAFYDMDAPGGNVTSSRYDLSSYVAGRPGEEEIDFGAPVRKVSRSETFVRPGAYIAPEYHDSTRQIRIPIGIKGSDWDDAVDTWEEIIAQLSDFPLAIRFQLSGSAHTVDYEVLPSSTWNVFYESWDQRPPAVTIRGELLLECQPYPIGTSSPTTFIGAGS